MEKKDQKSRIMRLLAQIVIIMAGLSVYAAGVALFVLPMDMIAAGTTGLGLVAQHYCPGHRDPGRRLHRRHGYPAAGTEKEVRDPGVCYHVCDGLHGAHRPDDLWRQGEDPVRPDHGHDVYHYPG